LADYEAAQVVVRNLSSAFSSVKVTCTGVAGTNPESRSRPDKAERGQVEVREPPRLAAENERCESASAPAQFFAGELFAWLDVPSRQCVNQGQRWVQQTMCIDNDGDTAHRFLRASGGGASVLETHPTKASIWAGLLAQASFDPRGCAHPGDTRCRHPEGTEDAIHKDVPTIDDRIKLIMDNINFLMQVSRMNKLNKNQMKNMIHVIGIENFIPTEGPFGDEAQNLVENVCNLVMMVPSTATDSAALKKDYAIYAARILKMRFRVMFEKMGLDTFVCTHITHRFSEFRSRPSNVVTFLRLYRSIHHHLYMFCRSTYLFILVTVLLVLSGHFGSR
jgi:hypothetical protein